MPYGEDITINVGDAVRIHPNYKNYKFKKLKYGVTYFVTGTDEWADHITHIETGLGDTILLNMDKRYFEHAGKEEIVERDYELEIGDVVLVAEGGYGLCPEDEGKYVEVIGFGNYFDDPGVKIAEYQGYRLFTLREVEELGTEGCIGYESFGEAPMILLNTKEEIKENIASALDKQVSGNHYKDCGIQPIEYIHANGLDYFQGNVIKYTTRHKSKNGKADIEKAIHYLELILELQYGD